MTERAGRPGATWETRLVRTERVIPDDADGPAAELDPAEPEPPANRAARRRTTHTPKARR